MQSIIVTLCCCLPLGVVAIIFAAQVNTKLAAGDIAGAREASDKAKLFCWISLALGLAGIVIGFLINGAAILSQMGR
ncbi:MAG TPA: CD225/dispanin family protein [Thermoanaerobaculia bacterium]